MTKHRQTASLGHLNNYTTDPETPATSTEAEIEALKKRVGTLELLLNDVMHQLDKPKRDQKLDGAKASKPQPDPQKPRPAETTDNPKAKIIVDPDPEVEACKSALLEYLSDGKKRRRGNVTGSWRQGTYGSKLKKKALGQLIVSNQIIVEKNGNVYLIKSAKTR